jgi:hypothetical protein
MLKTSLIRIWRTRLGRAGLYLSRNVNRDFQGPELRKHSGVGL